MNAPAYGLRASSFDYAQDFGCGLKRPQNHLNFDWVELICYFANPGLKRWALI